MVRELLEILWCKGEMDILEMSSGSSSASDVPGKNTESQIDWVNQKKKETVMNMAHVHPSLEFGQNPLLP